MDTSAASPSQNLSRIAFPLSLSGIWQLFLLTALPIHFWALLIAFRDITGVIDFTNVWDGIGATSYALLFALVESVLVTLVFLLLSFLVPKTWPEKHKILILGLLSITTTIWGILKQINFYILAPPKQFLAKGLFTIIVERSGRPIFYGGILLLCLVAVVIVTVVAPIMTVRRSQKFVGVLNNILPSFFLLSGIYLILDLIGLVIVLVRNN